MTDETRKDFDDLERTALDAWTAPTPPAGFADDVLARVDAPVAPRSRRWMVAVAGLAAAVLALGIWWQGVPKGPHVGHVTPTERTTIAIGPSVTAVVEAGADVVWEREGTAGAEITQDTGSVFYRIQPGSEVAVVTPLGRIAVRGTCFSVEVTTMKRAAAGAVVGALVATAVMVNVYEGKVEAASADETVEVEAGQNVTLRPDQPIAVREMRRPEAPEPAADLAEIVDEQPLKRPPAPKPSAQAAPASARTIGAGPEAVACKRSLAEVESEAEGLRARVRELEGAVTDATEKTKTYDLSAQTLDEMAEKCELRWDHPQIKLVGSARVPDEAVEELGLTDDQRDAINEELARSNERLLATIREVYGEVTGDEDAQNMAPFAMYAEVFDKTPRVDLQRVFQRLSAERAGHLDAPQDVSQVNPVERLYRALTTSGNDLQGAIADRVGEDIAQKLRDKHGGYGSKSRSSHGCPE